MGGGVVRLASTTGRVATGGRDRRKGRREAVLAVTGVVREGAAAKKCRGLAVLDRVGEREPTEEGVSSVQSVEGREGDERAAAQKKGRCRSWVQLRLLVRQEEGGGDDAVVGEKLLEEEMANRVHRHS